MKPELITKEKIKSIFKKKDYLYFESTKEHPFNLNIIGVRAAEKVSNHFDDFIVLSYQDDEGKIFLKVCPGTTDPGRYWLEHPMRKEGAAIVVPGQYRGL